LEQERPKRTIVLLWLEIVCVTAAALWLIHSLDSRPGNRGAWLVAPVVLFLSATVPTFLRHKNLAEIGLRLWDRPAKNLRLLGGICLVVFPALLCSVLLLKCYNVPLPLRPAVPEKGRPLWLMYQFLYVAVAEETFFRGYLQTNIFRLLTGAAQRNSAFSALIAIIISAAVFAVFHSVLGGDLIAMITFLPGLILGWLFFRTGSLLAPILFHGLANAAYALIGTVLT